MGGEGREGRGRGRVSGRDRKEEQNGEGIMNEKRE